MTKRHLAAALLLLATAAQATAATMTVHKSASCGCCGKWVEVMKRAGHQVKVVDHADMAAVKKAHKVPAAATSCHTTIVNGYVVEGHVPAADIARLLREKPKARGIAVAGMPMGSPGMEHGDHREPYQTLLIGLDGKTSVFARH